MVLLQKTAVWPRRETVTLNIPSLELERGSSLAHASPRISKASHSRSAASYEQAGEREVTRASRRTGTHELTAMSLRSCFLRGGASTYDRREPRYMKPIVDTTSEASRQNLVHMSTVCFFARLTNSCFWCVPPDKTCHVFRYLYHVRASPDSAVCPEPPCAVPRDLQCPYCTLRRTTQQALTRVQTPHKERKNT